MPTKTKMRTGWCIQLQCEGTKPKSPSGKALKTCNFWDTCPCRCHEEITEMCAMVGVERTLRDESEYKADLTGFWMPTPEWYASLRVSTDTDRPDGAAMDGDPAIGPPRASQPMFQPTPTGIRSRGQLEYDVKKVCDRFASAPGPVSLTLGFIAEQIHPDAPPSVGAIREVLMRWAKYGFATMGTDPLSFTGYTDEGREKGVDVMRSSWERSRKMIQAKADRGYR